MKTIEEHLKEALPEDQYAKAFLYGKMHKQDWEKPASDPADALNKGFIWDITEEGEAYWMSIHKNLKEKQNEKPGQTS